MTTITILEAAILAHISHSSHMPNEYRKALIDKLGPDAQKLAAAMAQTMNTVKEPQ